jgi:hypothetical protein
MIPSAGRIPRIQAPTPRNKDAPRRGFFIPAKPLTVLLLIVLCTQAAYAQSTTAATATTISTRTYPEFPQWARDIRRGEIIAFGVFPFMMFFSSFLVDTYRASQHNWDSRYMPWPLKGAGAVALTTDENVITLSAAIVGSAVFALADHLIVRIKRAKAEQQRLDLPEGELIILRKPWPPEEAADDAVDAVDETEAAGDTAEGADAEDAGTP